jgi:hypothetical protein
MAGTMFALAGCKKPTITIEPYSLVEGGAPSGPLTVRLRYDAPMHQEWRPGTPCVFPFDKEKDDPVRPWLEGAIFAERRSYTSQLHDFSKPIRVPFVPLAPSDRPLIRSGLAILRDERKTILVLLQDGKLKLDRDVENKPVKHESDVKPYPSWLELPVLAEAMVQLQREGALATAPNRTEATLYYLRGEEGPRWSRPGPDGDLDPSDFPVLSANVKALQEARHSGGAPVLRLTVQRGYQVWPKLARLVEDARRSREKRTAE